MHIKKTYSMYFILPQKQPMGTELCEKNEKVLKLFVLFTNRFLTNKRRRRGNRKQQICRKYFMSRAQDLKWRLKMRLLGVALATEPTSGEFLTAPYTWLIPITNATRSHVVKSKFLALEKMRSGSNLRDNVGVQLGVL